MTNLIKLFLFLAFSISLVNCGGFKKVDTRKTPVNAMERARKNVEEGKAASIGNIIKKRGGTNYEFSTSNPLWRATLDVLDFLPLSTVDYSGGVIITDWYSLPNDTSNRIKIAVFIVGRELRSDAVSAKVYVQNLKNNLWVQSGRDEELERNLEETIRNAWQTKKIAKENFEFLSNQAKILVQKLDYLGQ